MTGCGINWEKGKPERLTKDEMKPLLDEIEKMRKKNNIDAYNFTSNNRLYKQFSENQQQAIVKLAKEGQWTSMGVMRAQLLKDKFV